jgi:predicted nucleotidyltransferase
MHLVLRRDGIRRLDAVQGFETPGFEFGTMLRSFLMGCGGKKGLASALAPALAPCHFADVTLLAQRDRVRTLARLQLFDDARRRLRDALRERAAGHVFWVFGSLTRRGVFNSASDIDLAFESLPNGLTEYQLAAELEERLLRRVDLVDFHRSRLRDKIQREGERWIA